MKILVGAYAASPCHSQWNPDAESAFLERLAAIDDIGGLELPFFGDLHRHDPRWFLDNLSPNWDYVLTAIPGTMVTLGRSPHFGLASRSERGRSEALQFTEQARQAVSAIHRHLGRAAVRAVEIHSAPQQGAEGIGASAEDFSRSLSEIARWDWQGAALLVEHCDRFVPGQAPAKGFLSLEQEIAAIQHASTATTPAAVLVNWGRSALEDRDADAPLRHIRQAAKAGLLGGLIFSGCTVNDPLYGTWADSHAPFGGAGGTCVQSVMTLDRVAAAMQAARWDRLPVRGFKIQALPKSLDIDERVNLVRTWVEILNAVASESGEALLPAAKGEARPSLSAPE